MSTEHEYMPLRGTLKPEAHSDGHNFSMDRDELFICPKCFSVVAEVHIDHHERWHMHDRAAKMGFGTMPFSNPPKF